MNSSESLTESLQAVFEIQTIEKNPSKNRRSGSLQFLRLARTIDFVGPPCPLLKDSFVATKGQPVFPPQQGARGDNTEKIGKTQIFDFRFFVFFEKSPPIITDFTGLTSMTNWTTTTITERCFETPTQYCKVVRIHLLIILIKNALPLFPLSCQLFV